MFVVQLTNLYTCKHRHQVQHCLVGVLGGKACQVVLSTPTCLHLSFILAHAALLCASSDGKCMPEHGLGDVAESCI